MKYTSECFLGLFIAFIAFSVQARSQPQIFKEIAQLREKIANTDEPTLAAIDPFLNLIQVKAKQLVSLQVNGKAYAPAVVYFCPNLTAIDCPEIYADDTIHVYEEGYIPQFIVPSIKIKVHLSEELLTLVVAYRGNVDELHHSGYTMLKPIRVSQSGEIDLNDAVGRGKQVLLVFAQNRDRQRVKFVWLMDSPSDMSRQISLAGDHH